MNGLVAGFAHLLRPERAKDLLLRFVPEFREDRLQIHGCEILRTQFKTFAKPSSQAKTVLSLCYKLSCVAQHEQQAREHMLVLKAFREGRSKSAFAGYAAPPLPARQNAVGHIPALDALYWFFPNDPELPHLREVFDPQLVKKYLPYEKLPATIDQPNKIAQLERNIVHYYPEQRCTSRYELLAGTQSQSTFIYGKTLKHDHARNLYERMRRMEEISRAWQEGFAIAPALGYNEIAKTIWTAALPGKKFALALNRSTEDVLLKHVAKGLARLHQSEIAIDAEVDCNTHLPELEKKIDKLNAAFPDLCEHTSRLLAELRTTAPRASDLPVRLLHGDFQLHQLVVAENRIALFDFDEMALGDPMLDLASFMVDLWLHDPERAETRERIFYRNYCSHVAWEVSPARLQWYLKLHCLTKAYRELTYRLHQPALDRTVDQLINIAHAISSFAFLQ